MDKLKILNRIKQLYSENVNITRFLNEMDGCKQNSIEDIMISYDFQAGTYIKDYNQNKEFKNKYAEHISKIINNLCKYQTLLEVGVGEGTTLIPMISFLKDKPLKSYGFDISWSRVKYATKFMNELNAHNIDLLVGDLFCSPFKDNSIDIVYTSHSIEPNGGREKDALIELYRITNKYLILLEPLYELSNEQARQRMLHHGYVTNLHDTAVNLGFNIIEYRLFDLCSNPLNPTGIMIIKKELNEDIIDPLCCPITKTNFIKSKNAYFSEDSLLAYPIIDNIPCLLPQNAIVATKFMDI